MPPPLRLVIAEDHAILADLLAADLQQRHPQLTVIGTAADGTAARALILREKPDLALLDIDLPHARGTEIVAELKRQQPALKVIMFTHHTEPAIVRVALAAGADGYFVKADPPDQLIVAIETVMGGNMYLSPRIQRDVASGFADDSGATRPAELHLTARERIILMLIAEGQFNREIAAALNVTERTVEKRRAALLEKFSVRTTSELMVQVAKHGLV